MIPLEEIRFKGVWRTHSFSFLQRCSGCRSLSFRCNP